MDFKKQQDKIKEYIESHLPSVLATASLSPIDAFIDDYIDLDRYTKSKQIFYDFNNYNFDSLSNESNSEEFYFTVYFVIRNGKTSELRDGMLNYTSAFYRMFEESGCNLGGIADYGIIQTVNFYQAAEGNPNIKIGALAVKLMTER